MAEALKKTRIDKFCVECGKKIDEPFSPIFGNESQFCEKCEIGDLEGECSCSR
jgi:hypothetical protein